MEGGRNGASDDETGIATHVVGMGTDQTAEHLVALLTSAPRASAEAVSGRHLASLPDLLTIRELATYCQVSVSTVYDWNQKGVAPLRLRVGKQVLYPRKAVLNWLADPRRVAA